MQVHLALYKWKAETPKEELKKTLDQIVSLKDKVEGIVEIVWAENQSKYSEGYSHVILVRGKDQKALDEYRTHPDHESAAKIIESFEEHGIGVDFNTKE